MTKAEQEEDIAKKLNSKWWRISNLYAIEPDVGTGMVKFRPNAVQRLLFKNFWWLNNVPKSRQHGISTYVEVDVLDDCLFADNVTGGIVDKSMPDATKKLLKIKQAYDTMDDESIHPDTYMIGAMIKERIRIVKSNDSELAFSNGSRIWTGVSLRGGRVHYLHISELGPIAYNNPDRAEEIRTGAFNTIHEGSKIVIESTHEGGEFGLNYEMIRVAQQSPRDRKRMSRMHWQLHFFGWWQDPKNRLEVDDGYESAVTPELEELFAEKEKLCRMKLAPEQKYWYAMKRITQGDKMSKEHPFDVEEALSASIKGAIYGEDIAAMRNEGRICEFPWDRTSPWYVFWDMGKKDFMCMGLVQHNGRYWDLYDSFSFFGKGERFYWQKVLEWEKQYGPISMHFMPWDAGKAGEEGPSWVNSFSKLGMTNIRTVPRTPDQWIGIRHMRTQLPQFRFHAKNNDKDFDCGDVKLPSLLKALAGYHVKIEEKDGRQREVPVHDQCSHMADMMRTFAEAHARGMLNQQYGLTNNGRGTPASRQVKVDHGRFEPSGHPGRVKVGFGGQGTGQRIRY